MLRGKKQARLQPTRRDNRDRYGKKAKKEKRKIGDKKKTHGKKGIVI